ncbi:hypothetical protein B0H13DRAFT_2331117 [Mycena leptocephala]|nr:hypothetical protein B0H13DRAFT_2331117 [Mycena leptocephala]
MRSIAGARSKCNERSPSSTPPSSPPRALRPSSAPTPASAPNLGLPRTTNATCITAGVPLCGRPPSARNLSAFHVHPQRHTAPLVDDSTSPPPMRSTPRGGFPSPAPAAFAAMTRLWASSGRTTRRRCAHRASTNTRIPRQGSQTSADRAPWRSSARRMRRQRKRSRRQRCPKISNRTAAHAV